jgi:hypothetical protein
VVLRRALLSPGRRGVARFAMGKKKAPKVGSTQTTMTDMDPEFLAHLVMVLVNKKAFKPTLAAIKDKYYELFRGKGKEGQEDEEDDDA